MIQKRQELKVIGTMSNLTKGENYYKRDRNINYRDRNRNLATGIRTLETGKK